MNSHRILSVVELHIGIFVIWQEVIEKKFLSRMSLQKRGQNIISNWWNYHSYSQSFIVDLRIWLLEIFKLILMSGLLRWCSGKESTCQCKRLRRFRFDLWVGKIPWRRAWQPTPVFLPGESLWTVEPGGLQSTESQRVKHNRDDGVHTHPNVWQYTGNQKNIIF